MEGTLKYLYQEYPKAYLSEMNYLTSNGALNIISLDYSQQNAIYILYHYLYWVPNPAGGTLTFFDSLGNIIFISPNSVSTSSWAPIPLIRKGAKLQISCTPSAINTIPFSISFQYIMQGRV